MPKYDKPKFTGAILDNPKTLASLHQFKEVASAPAPVDWKPLDISKLPNYKVRNQDGSSGCVSFTIGLMCSIAYFIRTGNWVDFSPAWVYSQRVNKPQEGMVGTDAFKIASKGMIPDVILPSDNLSETDLNNPKKESWYSKIAEVFAFGDDEPVILPIGDIEAVASVIQETGKAVMVWFNFGTGEWTNVPKILTSDAPYAHSVTSIPPQKPGEMTYGIYNGEKAIVIQDSWGNIANTFGGKRIITESFFKNRNLFAAYTMRFKFDSTGTKPKYDGSISSLQDCLTYEGTFPSNIKSRGTFGSITIDAVKKFQAKYNLEPVGIVGPKTTELLKKLYP